MTRRIDRALSDARLPPLERSAWVEVDSDVLRTNAAALRALVRPTALGPVVKADGYGHGLEMAARCAVAGGAEWLCVADAAEASRLRSDGYRGRVFVLYPVPGGVLQDMARLNVDVTAGHPDVTLEAARRFDRDAPTLAVHLEIDTGMTRGGVAPESALDAASAITRAPSVELAGVWTHLAAPEDAEFTREQLSRFDRVLALIRAAHIETGAVHAAASGGLLASDVSGHAFVRPGLAFYGVHPAAGRPLPESVRPALTVRAHPVRLAEAPVGTRVGYAGTWTAERRSLIATLPIGYADGWSRSSSPGTSVLVEGRRAPVVGRVSSDSLTVDVTRVEGVGLDSEFTLLGSDGNDTITADAVADVRRTISWEVLQQLGTRLARIYTAGSLPIAVRRESTTRLTAAPGAALPSY